MFLQNNFSSFIEHNLYKTRGQEFSAAFHRGSRNRACGRRSPRQMAELCNWWIGVIFNITRVTARLLGLNSTLVRKLVRLQLPLGGLGVKVRLLLSAVPRISIFDLRDDDLLALLPLCLRRSCLQVIHALLKQLDLPLDTSEFGLKAR